MANTSRDKLRGTLELLVLRTLGATDPVSVGASAVLLVLVTAFASFLPARVAGRENPARVLRGE